MATAKQLGSVVLSLTLAMMSLGGAAGCSGDTGDMDEDELSEEQLAEALSTDDDVDAEEGDDSSGETGISEDELAGGGNKAFGLGVDAPAVIGSPLYAGLRANWKEGAWSMRTARTVFYVSNGDGKLDTTGLRTWVDAVKGAGLEPVVGVSVMRHGKTPVGHKTFRARFWKLLRQFPEVKAWGVVNEPDLELHDVDDKPAAAAKYFVDGSQTLRKCRVKKKCTASIRLIAGEFSYQGESNSGPFWKAYGEAMQQEVKTRKLRSLPRLWAFHPYADTTGATTSGTKLFSAFLDDLEKDAKLPKGTFRVWLTETGTILERGQAGAETCDLKGVNPNDKPDLQYRGGKETYALAKMARVDRVYWWQGIQGSPDWGGRWDSALADFAHTPRPAYCGLTKQPLAACGGEAHGRHCGAR
jgi:hypothetical protein